MRCRAAQVCVWARGSTRLLLLGSRPGRISPVRTFSAQQPPPADPAPSDGKGGAQVVKKPALTVVQHAGELCRQWGQRSAQAATALANQWWASYEEFVGINEVRVAQTKAEAAFMVARGMVREAHGSLETLQLRLKEVRDRLDRVSREEAHYLELATLEHKLLQEERRLRTTYENAEGSEREKFALFSAGVRESHEKERTRAERTKNWSVMGSVLGALIGVFGSTYINRVRLQELKTLLLEAQKGPENLQEALRVQAGNHRSQRDELRTLIDSLRVTLKDAFAPQKDAVLRDAPALAPAPAPAKDSPAWPVSALKELQTGGRRTESLLESLRPQLGHLGEGLGRVEGELSAVRTLLEDGPRGDRPPSAEPVTPVTPERPEGEDWWEAEAAVRRLADTERTLGDRIRNNTLYNAVFTYTAAAATISAVYLLTRGPA
ncbi:mitochondrial potassium channel isoform X2 [Clinocottus analis]|uniref:mitochondrial potassium channel isoform X2 n=1 Tax=Clinocottus analis TaxID=304258 RepID=UPI0035BFC4B3